MYEDRVCVDSQQSTRTLIKTIYVFSIIQDLSSCKVPTDFDLFPTESYSWVATTQTFTIKSVLHEAVVHGAYDW